MKKHSFSRIIDFVVKNIIIFFVVFVWTRFYVKSLVLTFFISFLVTFLIGLFFTLRQKKKNLKEHLTKEENLKISACTNEFLFSGEKENLIFFKNLFALKHEVKLIDNFVLVQKEETKTLIYPCYKTRKLTIDEATALYLKAKKHKASKLIITCKDYTSEAINLSRQLKPFKMIILNEQQTYLRMLKAYDYYPKFKNPLINEEKLTTQQLLHIMFNRKKTKSYFFSASILFLASFIIPYNLYYIIFSSLLYLMALYSYFNTPFNKTKKEPLID